MRRLFDFSMKSLAFLPLILVLCVCLTSPPAQGSETGVGVGLQLIGNTDLVLYETEIRQSLPYTGTLGGILPVSSAIEVTMGLVRENHQQYSELGRFSLIPELLVDLHPNLQIIAGLGAGVMGGGGDFTKHDLGGPFFFASKFGFRLPVSSAWGVELLYFHQSNGGLYEHNASLNMQMVGVYYSL